MNMRLCLIVQLFLVVAVIARSQKSNRFHPPFADGVTAEGIADLDEIVDNQNLTKKDQLEELVDWATKYDVRDAFEQFVLERQNFEDAMDEGVNEFLDALPKYFEEFRSIVENRTIPIRVEQEMLTALKNKNHAVTEIFETILMRVSDRIVKSRIIARFGSKNGKEKTKGGA